MLGNAAIQDEPGSAQTRPSFCVEFSCQEHCDTSSEPELQVLSLPIPDTTMDMDPDEMERKAVAQLGPFYKWLWGWSRLGCAPMSPQRELWTKLQGWKPIRYKKAWRQYRPMLALKGLLPEVVEYKLWPLPGPFEPDNDCVDIET